MKIYLHGPRAGQNFKVKGIQFINGVAEVPKILKILERYYNVKDYPPNGLEEEEVVQEQPVSNNNEQEEIVDKGEDVLKQIVESKKEELNKEKSDIKDWKAMPWWTAKAYVKEMTGKSPKNKETAIALMKEAGFE